jgi:hypothetical protein
MPQITNSTSRKTPSFAKHEDAPGININPGPFIGIVKNNIDPMRSGRLQVWIPEMGGAAEDSSSWRTVRYCSPFYGATSYVTRGKNNNFEQGAPHSYGMWMVPPDVGVSVLCMFVNGDPFRGYWFACVPEWPNLHMLPGIASGSWAGLGPEPVVDFNQEADGFKVEDFYKLPKATHAYQTQVWQRQGLLQDPIRGPGTSSAFRESPSRVFGISTPGPELAVPNANDADPDSVSGAADLNIRARQGGHQFVMDDGDANGRNQLVRLRSSNGNMVLLNDEAGCVYMINAKGSAWAELDGTGNIRMYSEGKFEVSAAEICLNAKGPVHISGATIDIAATGPLKMKGATADLMGMGGVKVGGMGDLHLSGMKSYLSGKMCVGITGSKHIDMKAGCITLNTKKVTEASMPGMAMGCEGPTHEPYGGHANSKASSPASSVSYGAVNGVPDGAAGKYGASASFGNTSNVPKYYGVVTNTNGPIKFNPGLQGSYAGQAANLGDAAKLNVYDALASSYTNTSLTLPISTTGFAVNINDPNVAVNKNLKPGEALNNPGMITDLASDPFAIGQINGLNVYATPEEGIAALTLMLDLLQANGAQTVSEFIESYVTKKARIV